MAEEQNDLQGVSSVVDRERFLLPGRGFTGNGKKSLSLARLVKSKSSIATSSGSEVRDVKTSLVIGGFSE